MANGYRRSRHRRVTREAARNAARVAAVGGLALVPLACANNDAEILSGARDRVDPTSVGTTTPSATATAAPSATTTPARGSTTTTTTPYALPAGTALNVTFTHAMAGSGVPKNPYIAVWVENSSGQLVKTVSLWYQQGRGSQWLRDLRAWFTKSGGQLPAVGAGASRSPGQYTVSWDGTDANGAPVPKGDYTIWVEAAREKGPYQTTSGAIRAVGTPISVVLPSNGELTGLSASTVL
ncbi:MAG: DUF2271 domain-containing protein [Actinobacteria bacterium]|nr:DUF2271 domain-containing protein [Actinomycetota bacterium]